MKIFGLERKAGFGIDFHQFNSSSALIGAYVRMKGYIWAVPDGRGLLLQCLQLGAVMGPLSPLGTSPFLPWTAVLPVWVSSLMFGCGSLQAGGVSGLPF